MFDFPEIAFQRQLIIASLDDFTPNAALPNVHGGQYGLSVELWKSAGDDSYSARHRACYPCSVASACSRSADSTTVPPVGPRRSLGRKRVRPGAGCH